MGPLWVVMSEMDQSALRIPDVLAMDDDVVALFHRCPRRNRNIVLDLDGQIARREFDDELLVAAGRAGPIRKQPDDGGVGRNLDVRLVVVKVGGDRRVIRLWRPPTRCEPNRNSERTRAFQSLTNLDGPQHLSVKRAVVLDVARFAEGDEKLEPGILRAGIEAVVVRRHRMR